MAKSFNVSFNINGAMDGSLQAALAAAANSMRGLGNAARAASASAAASRSGLAGMAAGLNQLQQAAQRYKQVQDALKQSTADLARTGATLSSAKAKYEADAAAVEKLKASLDALKKAQANAATTKTAKNDALKQLRQDLQKLKQAYAEAKRAGDAMKMSTLGAQIKSTQGAISAQQASVKAAAQAYKELSEKVKQAKTALTEANAAAQKSGADLSAARSSQQRLTQNYQNQLSALRSLQSSLSAAGFNTSSFASSESRLAGDIARVNAELQRQQQLLNAQRQSAQASQEMFNAYNNFQGALNTAQQIAAPFQSAAETAIDFEHSMSRVKALTQSQNIREGNMAQVKADMELLTAQARELGATTMFTAKQAADAMGYLGMAGWKTQQIYGTMPGMLNLAAAAGADLAQTADIVSDNMTAMGVPVKDAGHFMDVYAYALTNSNARLTDFGETMKYAAPVAKAYGSSLDETAAMVMMMANAGIKGSMAGTSLRMGLLRLAGPPKTATKEMEKLGLSLSDAQAGALEADAVIRGLGIDLTGATSASDKMTRVLMQLHDKTKNLSQDEKLATFKGIFGVNAETGWLALFDQGPEVFMKYLEGLRAADGYSAQVAETMNDDTRGALIRLESAWDAFKERTGEALTPAIRSVAESFAPLVTAAANFVAANPAIVQAAASIAAALATIVVGAAAVKLAFAGWAFVTSSINLVRTALAGLAGTSVLSSVATSISAVGAALANAGRAAMALAFSPVGAVLLAIALAGLWCYQNWDKVAPVLSNIAGIISGALGPAITQVQTALSALSSSGGFSALSAAASQLASVVGGTLVKAFAALLTVAAQVVATVIQLFADLITISLDFGTGLFDAFSKISEGDFSGAFDSLKSTAFKTFGDIKQMGSHVMDGVVNGAENVKSVLDALSASQVEMGASKVATGVTSGITQAANMVAPETQPLDTSATQAALDQVGNSASNAASQMQTMEQATAGVDQMATQFAAAGTGVQQLSTSAQQAGTGVQQFSTNAQQAATTAQTFSTSAQQAAAGSDALGMSAQNATGGIEALSASAANAVGGVSNLGSAASSAAGSVSGLGAAVQAACSQLASAGASAAAAVASAAPKANYKGGIYKKGAFLTTFAEKSPEAAIPIENSNRARELWTKTGQMLGILPGDAGNYDSATGQTEIQRQAIEITRAARQQHVMQQLGGRRVPTASSQRRLSQAEHNRQLREQVLSGQKSLDAAINEVQLPSGATIGDALKHLPTSKSKPILPQENRNARVNIPMITTPPVAPQDSPITGGRKNIPMITTPPVAPTNRGTFNDTPTSSGFTALGNILDGLGGFGKIFGKSGTGLGSAFGGFSSLGSIGRLIDGLTGNKNSSGIFGLSEVGSLGDLSGTVLNSNSGQNSAPSTFHVTINVNVSGNADENAVRNGVEQAIPSLNDWARNFMDYQHDAARRSFA